MKFESNIIGEHQDMVAALVKPGINVLDTLTPEKVNFWHGATGVATEAGELLDAAKKFCIYNKPLDRINVIEELGDIEFYLEQVRQEIGISREETLIANMDKLGERYKNFKYTDQAAITRADKVV